MIKFRPLQSGNQTITALLKYGKDGENIAACGHGGYFALLNEGGFKEISTKTKEDLWAMCAIGECVYVAGTKSTYTYTPNSGFSRWCDAPDMKELVAYGSKIYGAGYDSAGGGLSINDGTGWKSLVPFSKIQAARSMQISGGCIVVGAKSGKLSFYNISQNRCEEVDGGVPGNSVLLIENCDTYCQSNKLAAHQTVKYNGEVLRDLTAPKIKRINFNMEEIEVQSCYGAGVKFGKYYFLGGSDGLMALYDSSNGAGKIVNQFTKGTILAMEILEATASGEETCLLLAGAGIKAQDGKLYNAVYVPLREALGVEVERPVEPPEIEPPVGHGDKIRELWRQMENYQTLLETAMDAVKKELGI